jgi:uncharacterized cupredoxin-like copper-binding protein
MPRTLRALPLILAFVAVTAGAPAAQDDVAEMIVPDTVHVSLVDGAIEMPDTLAAGPHVFHVVNNGTARHGFEIESDGEDHELDDALAPGETARLEATLAPGLFRAYCPVGQHAEHGMQRAVVVTARL